MNKSIAILATQSAEMTMTLKEITDILGVRHDNAMRTVASMMADEAFGTCPQIEEKIETGNGGKRSIITYQLNKPQPMFVLPEEECMILVSGYAPQFEERYRNGERG